MCKVEGCEKEPRGGYGWCRTHYMRWRRTGDPVGSTKPPIVPAEVRFWRYVRKQDDGCWIWTGSISSDGYGQLSSSHRNKPHRSHRFSYTMHVGEIPAGLELDHLCRVRACVNPEHLEAVTRQVNQRRGNSPSGIASRKTHCVRNHPFDEENTYITTQGKRLCRKCSAIRQAAYVAERRARRALSTLAV